MIGSVTVCCPAFEAARDATFAQAVERGNGWLLFGTDHLSVSAGAPIVQYWPIDFCPFCGVRLPPPPVEPPRGNRDTTSVDAATQSNR
jgi:hypothetical protein